MRTENKDKELNHRHFIGLRLTDKTLKGYCFMSCKTVYVMISSFPSEEEKMIVAAHELGRIILHRSQLKMAPMQDDTLYNMTDNTEYQANLFAAVLTASNPKKAKKTIAAPRKMPEIPNSPNVPVLAGM